VLHLGRGLEFGVLVAPVDGIVKVHHSATNLCSNSVMSLRHNGAWLARRHGLFLAMSFLMRLGVNLFLEARLGVLSLKV
jgi:hypothetical protein